MAKTKSSSQEKLMREIHSLLSSDLGYIFGRKEGGPNGNKVVAFSCINLFRQLKTRGKKAFLDKSARFLRTLGNDLGFQDFKINKNPAGIAVSGEVSLYGVWSDENGVMFEITQPLQKDLLLYRSIKAVNDYRGGNNHWLSLSLFANADYQGLKDVLLSQCCNKGVKENAA